jgi:hypothetical protein
MSTVSLDVSSMLKFLKQCAVIDLRKTEAKLPEDKMHVLSEVGCLLRVQDCFECTEWNGLAEWVRLF